MQKESETIRMGRRVAEEREAAGLTQSALAAMIGIDPGTMSKIESGGVALSLKRATEIADALQVSLTRLCGPSPDRRGRVAG